VTSVPHCKDNATRLKEFLVASRDETRRLKTPEEAYSAVTPLAMIAAAAAVVHKNMKPKDAVDLFNTLKAKGEGAAPVSARCHSDQRQPPRSLRQKLLVCRTRIPDAQFSPPAKQRRKAAP
jgi:hypothetical protein